MSDLVGNPEDRFSHDAAHMEKGPWFKTGEVHYQTLDSWFSKASVYHYENLPMQYTEIFFSRKNLKFHQKNVDIFLIFAQNIDCGYTLEPPRRGTASPRWF